MPTTPEEFSTLSDQQVVNLYLFTTGSMWIHFSTIRLLSQLFGELGLNPWDSLDQMHIDWIQVFAAVADIESDNLVWHNALIELLGGAMTDEEIFQSWLREAGKLPTPE